MDGSRGSAIVLSMLLLVLLSALGMFMVSVPVGSVEGAGRHHRAAVARNMARAGANAAIARFPVVSGGGSPYVRQIPVGPNVTGRYSVTSQKAATGNVPGPGPGIEEYDLVSVGDVTYLPVGDVRVVARIRYSSDPAGRKAHILRWEESGPR
jgi:hypothetical protein